MVWICRARDSDNVRITELVSPFPDSHFSLRSYGSLVSNVFPGADGSTMVWICRARDSDNVASWGSMDAGLGSRN
jgi:hypothetical protein